MSEALLLQKAREALRAGRVPACAPARVWGGPGRGAPCPICAEPVKPAQAGFEVEFAADYATSDMQRSYSVHVPCIAAWEYARHDPPCA